jgi:hypothetical protein
MSAATEPAPTTSTTPSWYNRRSLVAALYWGAFLVLLLVIWVANKHAESAAGVTAWAVGVVLIATVALAGWQTWQLFALRRQPAQQSGVLEPQRRLIGLALVALAAILLLAMVWLYVQVGTASFPEASSGVVLALVGLGVGLTQLPAVHKGLGGQHILDRLLSQRQPLTFVLLALGAVLFGVGLWMFLQNRDHFRDILPFAGALVLLGLAFAGHGLWLLLASSQDLNANRLRIFVLVLGGAVGVIISLMTAMALVLRWDAIFVGGTAAWHGERAWQLWLIIYVELFGLVLMLGSFSLARGDVRRNPVLRRALYGYNAVFTGLLMLALLVMLNILVYASMPYNFNWTSSQAFYSLSPQSTQILDALKKPVTIYVLMSQNNKDYADVRTLLENIKAYSSKVQVQFVSPDADPANYDKLVNEFKKIPRGLEGSSRGLLIVYGYDTTQKEPESEFIRAAELSDRKPDLMGSPHKATPHEFRGEQLIMSRLSLLAHQQKTPIIYFTLGFGEPPILEQRNLPTDAIPLRNHLERRNFKVRTLYWAAPDVKLPPSEKLVFSQKGPKAPHQVPEDASALVILAPVAPHTPGVLKALDEYMVRGGKLLVFATFLNPEGVLSNSRLDDFLKRHGVGLEDDLILETPQKYSDPNYYVTARISDRNDTNLARQFARYRFLVTLGRTVRPAPGPTDFRAEVLLEVAPEPDMYVWGDKDFFRHGNLKGYVNALLNAGVLEQIHSTTPIPVAVTVTSGTDKTPRLVVFGDANVATRGLPPPNQPVPPNLDLVSSAISWLTARPELVGIEPKRSNYYRLQEGANIVRMELLPLGLVIVSLIGLGVGVWVVRRR